DQGRNVLREHATRRLGDRNGLGSERSDLREHTREGFVDRQQLRHQAHTLTGVISVIVPVHDEERSVALLYDELDSAVEQLDAAWEVVFVDDGSTDGTF